MTTTNPDRNDDIQEILQTIQNDIKGIKTDLGSTNTKLDRFNNYFVSMAIAVTTMAVGAIFAASGVVIIQMLLKGF